MTNAALKSKVLSLLNSSDGYDQFLRAFQSAVESHYADETDPPAELAAAMGALDATVAAFEALDEATR